MLDHIGLIVADVAKSKVFFDAALAPLGVSLLYNLTPEQTGGRSALAYGEAGKPYFWAGTGGAPTAGLHVAFTCDTRAAVDAFYGAAMAAGGRDNGAPGLRAHYHPNYYGAFVLDPDGHNIEAVCHRPE